MVEFTPGSNRGKMAGVEMPGGLSTASLGQDSLETQVVLDPDCENARLSFAEAVRNTLDFNLTDAERDAARARCDERAAYYDEVQRKIFKESDPRPIVLFLRGVGYMLTHKF